MERQDVPIKRAPKRPTVDDIDAALRAAGLDPSMIALYPDKVDVNPETLQAVAQWWARRHSQGV